MSTFSQFNEMALSKALLQSLVDINYTAPTPIQQQAIPVLLSGSDILGQAQTGTGKTAAFALPLLQRLDLTNNQLQLLILAPTRELAQQISAAIAQYAKYLDHFNCATVCGGDDYRQQIRQIKRGVQVIVSTPGRLIDLTNKGVINLATVTAVVLDEADEMLKMGFIDDVEWVLERTSSNCQLALFSATMPPAILKITQKYLKSPKHIVIKNTETKINNIEQQFIVLKPHAKITCLKYLLEVDDNDGVIIFVKTKNESETLADELKKSGHSAIALNGDMPQELRKKSIEKVKSGNVDILIATDVAARGLDIERIGLVINYDAPYNTEAYVHRIGRTGRAGRTGKAILFLSPREVSFLHRLERVLKCRLEKLSPPSAKLVQEKRVQRLQSSISQSLNHPQHSAYSKIVETLTSDLNINSETLAAALLGMSYQNLLSVPKEIDNETHSESSYKKDGRKSSSQRKGKFESKGQFESFKGNKRNSPRHADNNDPSMELFRIDVGHTDGVKPKNIVGAIANEAGIEGHFIRKITINDDHSTFMLPKGMPSKIYHAVKKAWICGKQINLSRI